MTIRVLRDGRGGYLCPFCGYGPYRTPERAWNLCPNKGGRNHDAGSETKKP